MEVETLAASCVSSSNSISSLPINSGSMKTSKCFSWLVVVTFGLMAFASGQPAYALITREWVGANNADPTVGANWNTGGSTGTVAGSADEARFTDFNGTSPLNVTIPIGGWNPLYIGFSGQGSPTGTFPGVNGGNLATIPN